MKNSLASLKPPALIGFLLLLPFLFLEFVNRRNFDEGFPIPLFVILWVLSSIFILLLTPFILNIQAGKNITANPAALFVRVAFMALIAILWAGIVIDQMPCFMGVPFCD